MSEPWQKKTSPQIEEVPRVMGTFVFLSFWLHFQPKCTCDIRGSVHVCCVLCVCVREKQCVRRVESCVTVTQAICQRGDVCLFVCVYSKCGKWNSFLAPCVCVYLSEGVI